MEEVRWRAEKEEEQYNTENEEKSTESMGK